MLPRLEYLARTLSRTHRKDSENYVLNALWNRLDAEARAVLKPVSQQSVRTRGGRQFYIDLFFPQLGIAVECDEHFHTMQQEADRLRQDEIIARLTPVKYPDLFTSLSAVSIDSCEFLRIPIPPEQQGDEPSRTVTLAQLDAIIDTHVARIHQRLAQLRHDGAFVPWSALELAEHPEAFYEHRGTFTVADGVIFRTIADICNTLLGDDYRGIQTGYFTTRGMRAHGLTDRHKLWCPKLDVATNERFEWRNTLSPDGTEIRSHSRSGGPARQASADEVTTNLTFAQVREPVTRQIGYRFVGVFERVPGPEGVTDDGSAEIHRRVATAFPRLQRTAPI